MKTIIFNGSPRKEAATLILIEISKLCYPLTKQSYYL
jgi:hypothetical protein